MPLSKDLRVKALKALRDKEPYGTQELFYAGSKQKFNVYKINVDNIIFNKYNGRIGTYVKSYEKFSGVLNPDNETDEKIIIDYLWKSNEKRNKETLQDIKTKEQLVPGIVSADGIIVDGNRRSMLLKKIAQERNDTPTYFIAVILPDTLDENPKEIRKLETMVQMGEDAKVDYNPIEKYVKCKDLREIDGFTDKQIAKMFGDPVSKIEIYFGVLELMNDYLDNHLKGDNEEESSYSGMYQVLTEQKREGPFVDLYNYIKTLEGGNVRSADWTFEKEDIEDVKSHFFDYIRAGFGSQQDIRYIANPKKDSGFFTKQKVWDEFQKEHLKNLDEVKEKSVDEKRKENPNTNVTDIIIARDNDYKKQVEDNFKKNLKKKKRDLEDITIEVKPYELLEAAHKKLMQIDDSPDFSDDPDFALKTIKDINKILWQLQKPLEKNIK